MIYVKANPTARLPDIAKAIGTTPRRLRLYRHRYAEFRQATDFNVLPAWDRRDWCAEARRLREQGKLQSVVHLAIQFDLGLDTLRQWYRDDKPGWRAATYGLVYRDRKIQGQESATKRGREAFRKFYAECRAEGRDELTATYDAYDAAYVHAMKVRRERLAAKRGMSADQFHKLKYPNRRKMSGKGLWIAAREQFRTMQTVRVLWILVDYYGFTPALLDEHVAGIEDNTRRQRMERALAYERARIELQSQQVPCTLDRIILAYRGDHVQSN
ncbi:MAG: hypothetical protein ABL893_01450 [Hyphomicrobium sp.]